MHQNTCRHYSVCDEIFESAKVTKVLVILKKKLKTNYPFVRLSF